MNKELERWQEIGDAAAVSPGTALILLAAQALSILKKRIFGRGGEA